MNCADPENATYVQTNIVGYYGGDNPTSSATYVFTEDDAKGQGELFFTSITADDQCEDGQHVTVKVSPGTGKPADITGNSELTASASSLSSLLITTAVMVGGIKAPLLL